jgi:hypothetical protein
LQLEAAIAHVLAQMRASYALHIADTLIRSIYPAQLSTIMKSSTQSTEWSLEKNLDRDGCNHLSTTAISTLELIIIEQEA